MNVFVYVRLTDDGGNGWGGGGEGVMILGG